MTYLHVITLQQDNNYINVEIESDDEVLTLSRYKSWRSDLKYFDNSRSHIIISHTKFIL